MMTTAGTDGNKWIRLSHAYGLFVAALLGYFLFRIPIQVYDCFTDFLSLARPMSDIVRDATWQTSFLRPGRYVQLKIVYELAAGHYYYAFRLVHAAHVLVLVVLTVRLIRPDTVAGAVTTPLALAVVVGAPSFAGTLREAFPINHYLTIVVACVAAANLAFARRRWWTDVLAAVLLAVAALTIESGVLVWVVFAGAYLVGLRGVSRGGLAGVTLVLTAYFLMRFVVLDVGLPAFEDRESGFGLHRYNGHELRAMFGANPLPFYAYNVVASISSVLVAEPRDGIFRIASGLVGEPVQAPFLIGFTASGLATALVVSFSWSRRRLWLSRRFDRGDQIVLLFWMVLGANAALGYAYTKDVIMAPAGVFFAAAVFVACRHRLETLPAARHRLPVMVLLAALAFTWSIRTVGLHASLVGTAGQVREQWAYVDDWLAARYGESGGPPHLQAMKRLLQEEALVRHPAGPLLKETWTRWFEME